MKRLSFYLANILLYGLFSASPLCAEEAKPELPKKVQELIKKTAEGFAKRLFPGVLTLDDDGDGEVSHQDLVTHLLGWGFAKSGGPVPAEVEKQGGAERYRQFQANSDLSFLKLLEKDPEGNIGEEQMAEAFRKALFQILSPQALLDLDGDGKLTLKEAALSSPIREGEDVDKDGFTQNQRDFFSHQDLNGDGYITDGEYLGEIDDLVEDWMRAILVTFFLGSRDLDNDGILTRQELATLLPAEKDALPEKIEVKELRYWVRELPLKKRVQFEKDLVASK